MSIEIIAELGINHGGSLDVARKMVDAAIGAGARIIKHQTHIPDEEMTKRCAIYDLIKRCALSEEQEWKLVEHVRDRGAEFLSTPFCEKAVDRLETFNVKRYKIGSGEMLHVRLLKRVWQTKKPSILSTGMHGAEDIAHAVDILGPDYILHCTNAYPTKPVDVRVRAVEKLKMTYPWARVGLSDHTTSNVACFAAVTLGAVMLERHFTDSMDRDGPDIACSMDPKALRELIEGCQAIEEMMVSDDVGPVRAEDSTKAFALGKVVALRPIKKGEVIQKKWVGVKRTAGQGISGADINLIVGKESADDFEKDENVTVRNWDPC